jgi:hypothetical protein
MEVYQEVAACPNCETRLTVCGERKAATSQVTPYEVSCPACWTAVRFTIPGLIDQAKARLICYERPISTRGVPERHRRPQAEAEAPELT